MKSLFKYLIKYLLSLVAIFLIALLFVLLIQLIVLKNVDDNVVFIQQLKYFFNQSIYNAILIASHLSLIFFTLFILRKEKFSYFFYLIPVSITTFLIFIILTFFKSDITSTSLTKNPNLYLIEKSFINYHLGVPQYFVDDHFQAILNSLNNEKDRKVLQRNYENQQNRKFYILKSSNQVIRNNIAGVLSKSDQYHETIFYFDQIEESKVKNAIMVKDGKIRFFKELNLEYHPDWITLNIPQTGTSDYDVYQFNRLQYIYDIIPYVTNIKEAFNKYQEFYFRGSLGGLMVSALIFDKGHCVLFLGKTFYSHSASLHPGV